MEKTSGLGRGLGSLIPNKKLRVSVDSPIITSDDLLDSKEKIWELPVGNIVPNPHQPRQDFDALGLSDLEESIKEHGIIQPLIVTKIGDGSWQLIAGERRLRAAKSLGLKTVPAIVRDLNEQKKLELALIENLQRKNLNALEVASAYQKLMDQFNLSLADLSRKVGKSVQAISNTIRILNVHGQVKEAIISGKIFEGHARVLAGLPEEDQLELLDRIINQKWNVREAEKGGREVVVKKHLRKLAFDPEVKAKEEELQKVLGTKVDIKKFGPTGQIIIKFFSEEELNEIYKKII
jgi:ParB family chromosome partitioning protein